MIHQVKSIFKLFYTFLYFVLNKYLSLYPNQIKLICKTYPILSNYSELLSIQLLFSTLLN